MAKNDITGYLPVAGPLYLVKGMLTHMELYRAL